AGERLQPALHRVGRNLAREREVDRQVGRERVAVHSERMLDRGRAALHREPEAQIHREALPAFLDRERAAGSAERTARLREDETGAMRLEVGLRDGGHGWLTRGSSGRMIVT